MKRSEINKNIAEAKALMAKLNFHLPQWVYWTPEDWKSKGKECDEIRDCSLGWDLTDFGWGDFDNIGLTLITIRNGKHGDGRYPKPY